MLDSLPVFDLSPANRSVEGSTASRDAFDSPRPATLSDLRVVGRALQGEARSTEPDTHHRPFTGSTADSTGRRFQSEANFTAEVSVHSDRLERGRPSEANPAVPDAQPGEAQPNAASLAGDREGWISIEQESAPESHSFTEDARTIRRDELSIPSEYLVGIREWLASPPPGNEEVRERSLQEVEVFKDAEPADRTSHGRVVHFEPSPQNDIQEFSLSIGSIRIVVEEPPKPSPEAAPRYNNTVPPAQSSPVTAQAQSRDAFALTRNYFRGF
jgi:hypothetical protein